MNTSITTSALREKLLLVLENETDSLKCAVAQEALDKEIREIIAYTSKQKIDSLKKTSSVEAAQPPLSSPTNLVRAVDESRASSKDQAHANNRQSKGQSLAEDLRIKVGE